MTKRFVAFLMILVLCISMVTLSALAGPVSPDCEHPDKQYRTITTYEPWTPSQHHRIERRVLICNVCHDELSIPNITYTLVPHFLLWSDFHNDSSNTHVFKKYCKVCRDTIEEYIYHCTGDPHVTFVYH